MINSEIITITPDLAKKFLERNTGNRPIQKTTVDRYAKIISDGYWEVTHQGIGFEKSGRLIDGQHRLHAIIKADKPVMVMVTYGLDHSSFKALDNGKQRLIADSLSISKKAGQVVNLLSSICYYGNVYSKIAPYEAEPFSDFIYQAHDQLAGATPKVVGSAGVRTVICYFMMVYPDDYSKYAIGLYNMLVKRDFESFSDFPIAAVFERRIPSIEVTGSKNQGNIIALADFVYRPENQTKKAMKPRETDVVIYEMHQGLQKWLGLSAVSKKSTETTKTMNHAPIGEMRV